MIPLLLLPISCAQSGESQSARPATPQASPTADHTPIANAGPNFVIESTEPGEVVLVGQSSRDPDGDPLTYQWTQLRGPSVDLIDAQTPLARFLKPSGEHVLAFKLEVADPDGNQDHDVVTITLNHDHNRNSTGSGDNTPPVAIAIAQPTAQAGFTTSLRGGGSHDADNNPLTYAWTQVSGPRVNLSDRTAERPTFAVPRTSGTVTFSLVVSDGMAESEPALVSIRIDVPRESVAYAGENQTVARGAQVSLTGTATTSLRSVDLPMKWTQIYGDRVSLEGSDTANPTFTAPDRPGHLVFQYQVDEGRWASEDNVAVIVEYDPVFACNIDSPREPKEVLYCAGRDERTGRITTSNYMASERFGLIVQVGCHHSLERMLGFTIVDLSQQTARTPSRIQANWRFDEDAVNSRSFEVKREFGKPVLHFFNSHSDTLDELWNRLEHADQLLVEVIDFAPVQDTFDLTALRDNPVWENIIFCGSY